MAFRRFRRSFRKRSIRRRKFRRQSLAMRAYRLARRVDTRAERKYFNTTYTSTLATSFNVFCPVEITQGDTGSTRDGLQIDHRYSTIRCAFDCTASSNVTPCAIRVVAVQALQQPLGQPILGASVFNDPTSWNSVYAFPEYQGFFRVLKDKTIVVTPNTLGYASAGATADSFDRLVTWTWKLKPRHKRMLWSGSTGTSFVKNQIYILLAKSNGGYTITPDIEAQTCFIDS